MKRQKDGRYRAKVTVGHDSTGKAVVKWVSGRTKKELEAAKAEAIQTYIAGISSKRREVLFETYAREWYETYKKPSISYSSRASYATIFNNHILPALANRQLRAISANELQTLLNSKAGACAATVGYIHSILRNIFKLAYAQGIIDRDPSVALKKPHAVKTSRRALTEAETAAALRVAQDHPQGLLIHLLYYTGMRLGEACGLMWADVDFKERVIHVRRDVDFKAGCIGTVKTEYSLRDIPIVDDLFTVLTRARGIGYVFPAPDGDHWRNTQLNRLWKDLARAMCDADPTIENKDGASVLTAHYFRHNFASVLYNAGVDVLAAQKMLGHAKASTTLDIYSHISEKQTKVNADKIAGAFAAK